MKRLLKLSLPLLVTYFAAATASGQQSIEPADYADVNAALMENHVLPRYERLVSAIDEFSDESKAYCGGSTDVKLSAVQARFHDAMDAWMGAQHIRFGPVLFLQRHFRFYFWPRARGKVADAVAELVSAELDETALATRVADANVAAQGFLAAEFLLFHERYLGIGDGSKTGCELLVAVAGNMQNMATGMLAEWREGAEPFTGFMTTPGPDNPFYKNHAEGTLAFFQSLYDSLQIMSDVNLKPVIGKNIEKARPIMAESRLSERSRRNIVVTLETLKELYGVDGQVGLGNLTEGVDPKLHKLMKKAFNATLLNAKSLKVPIEQAAVEPAKREQVEKLSTQVQAIKQIVRKRLSRALGLTIGFNALDGD